MRILHVLDHSVPLHSGYAFRTLAILREQRALGWETLHLTSPKQGDSSALLEHAEGLPFFRTAPRRGLLSQLAGVREHLLMRDLERRISQVAQETAPEILHAHSPVLDALPTLRVGRKLAIPVVYEVRAFWEDAAASHGTSREGGLRFLATRALETHALRRADAVTTICDGLRNDMIARGIPGERITVVPNAVDVTRFRLGGLPDGDLKARLGIAGSRVLGFVGSFYGYEGLDLLVRAVPAILERAPDTKVLLVGGGDEELALQDTARRLSLKDKVIFAGRVPHDDVQRYYDLIDVLVYPRLSIRLTELVTPLKPLEAMAQGRLLAASDVGGHRELIRHGENGILFPAGSEGGLAAAVVSLLESRDRWPALRSAARRYVETERNWPASVARYREVYERLTAPGRSTG